MIKLKDILLEQNQESKENAANIRLMELLGKYRSVVEGFINKLNFYVQDTQMFCKQKDTYIKKATDDFKGVILTMQRGEKKETEVAVIDGLIKAVDKKAVDVLINIAKKQSETALSKAKRTALIHSSGATSGSPFSIIDVAVGIVSPGTSSTLQPYPFSNTILST